MRLSPLAHAADPTAHRWLIMASKFHADAVPTEACVDQERKTMWPDYSRSEVEARIAAQLSSSTKRKGTDAAQMFAAAQRAAMPVYPKVDSRLRIHFVFPSPAKSNLIPAAVRVDRDDIIVTVQKRNAEALFEPIWPTLGPLLDALYQDC